jgi:hypothetical protein
VSANFLLLRQTSRSGEHLLCYFLLPHFEIVVRNGQLEPLPVHDHPNFELAILHNRMLEYWQFGTSFDAMRCFYVEIPPYEYKGVSPMSAVTYLLLPTFSGGGDEPRGRFLDSCASLRNSLKRALG